MGQWWKARSSAGWRDRPVAVDEKKGKKYRNLPADVFVIADEDDEGGGLFDAMAEFCPPPPPSHRGRR